MASEPIRITWLLGMLAVKQRDDLKTMRQVVRKAKKALQAGKLSAVEIAVLATQAGMTMEQIEEEYRKDSQARREVLMSVLGDSSNPFVQKFLQRYPSRFLSAGYDLEDQFVHNDTVAELEQIRSALNK
ncbi:hypothetical protein Q1695_011952 [Nippostrongylus brasiliensis]|nr:hypothetical protein Q1695_011952 [Nippostrongylus brasiliensis]